MVLRRKIRAKLRKVGATGRSRRLLSPGALGRTWIAPGSAALHHVDRGLPGATIEGVRFESCEFRGVETAEVLSHAGEISFHHVLIEPASRARSRNSIETAPKL